MKTLLTWALLACLCLPVKAQHLQTYQNLLLFENLTNNLRLYPESDKALSTNQIASVLDTVHIKNSDAESRLVNANKQTIVQYLKETTNFGEAGNKVFYDNNLPFNFVLNNGQIAFVQTGISSKYDFNSLKLNADDRAKYVIKNIILPSLSNFESLLKIPTIQYFAIVVGYKAKNFSDDTDIGTRELTSLIVSKMVLKQYIKSLITDEDVMKKSLSYNGTSQNKNLRKLVL